MADFDRYLTEEVAVDFSDGLVSRPEALRRLGLLGVAAGPAAALLAARVPVGSTPDAAAPPTVPGSGGPGGNTPAGPAALPTEPVTFPGPSGALQGAWAAAEGTPRGAVLVIHENKGLTDHIRSVAGRLAASGFSALAVDLLSEEGGTATFTDPAQATAALKAAPTSRFVADMRAGLDELELRAPGRKRGAAGFCFGGGMVWTLLAAGEPRLWAAAPFYGPLPEGADFAGSPHAAVLAVYAEQDTRVNASRDAADTALRKVGLTHEVVTFPGVDHAFFNDTGQRYDAVQAAAAYRRLVDWFGRYLS